MTVFFVKTMVVGWGLLLSSTFAWVQRVGLGMAVWFNVWFCLFHAVQVLAACPSKVDIFATCYEHKISQESKLWSAVQIKLDVVKLRFYGFDVNKSIDWSCTWINMLNKICSIFLRQYQLPWGFELWIQRSCHVSLSQSNSMLLQPPT